MNGTHMPMKTECITSCVCMAISLFLSFVLYDLEQTTFLSAALSFILYSQIHDNQLCRHFVALAQVFGRCDSDDSPDVDNGNGCVVVLYRALYTKPRAASLALPDMGSAPS